MSTREKDRPSTADLARGAEYKAPGAPDPVVNRAEAERVNRAADRTGRTNRAEDLWDETVEQREARAGAPAGTPVSGTPGDGAHPDIRLFEQEETAQLWRRWSDIQAGFVDQPRRAVEAADSLVAETMQRLAQVFAGARQTLEHQWDRGDDVTTEDLRVTLQRYRSFFDRLLSV